jgi:NitT/TauT family transport system permease protein
MTLGTLALGMLIGMMIAVLLTVFAAWTRIGADLLALLTLTLYPVPAIALLPLLILWFDTSPTSLVVVTVCSVTLPIAINLSAGLKSVNPTIMLVGQNLGLRGWGMFSAVLLPAALPHAICGLRAGWASGWRTVIVAGLVFGVAGGRPTFFTNDAGDFLPAPELLAGILTIAFAGILVEATFRLLERGTVVRWGMKVGRE